MGQDGEGSIVCSFTPVSSIQAISQCLYSNHDSPNKQILPSLTNRCMSAVSYVELYKDLCVEMAPDSVPQSDLSTMTSVS